MRIWPESGRDQLHNQWRVSPPDDRRRESKEGADQPETEAAETQTGASGAGAAELPVNVSPDHCDPQERKENNK